MKSNTAAAAAATAEKSPTEIQINKHLQENEAVRVCYCAKERK